MEPVRKANRILEVMLIISDDHVLAAATGSVTAHCRLSSPAGFAMTALSAVSSLAWDVCAFYVRRL